MDDQEQPDVQYRKCEACGSVLVLSPKFWPRSPGTQHTFRHTCKSCERKKKQKKKMDRMENAAIESYLSRVISGGANVPHTAELLESLMHYFGGVNGFASMAMKQYWDAPPGGRIRNSVLEMVVRLATKNTEQGGAKKPIQLYSEEELEQEINQRLEQAVLTYGGKRYINAPEEVHATSGAPAANGPDHIVLPKGRTEDVAGRIEREAHRSLEAIQANAEAVGVSPLPVERDAGDRRQS
jgi:hypothetical protein